MRAARSTSVTAPEQSVRSATDALPLSFMLEGKSRDLTTLVQATMALWMVGIAFEGGGMLHRFSLPEDSFEADLLRYMVYIIVGTLAAALGALVLTLNLRNTNYSNWRLQDVQSTLTLVVIDGIAVYHTQNLLRGMISTASSGASQAEWISLVARAFLLLSGACLVFIFNCLFVREFGCFIWLSNQQAGFQRLLDRNPTWNRIMSRTSGAIRLRRDLSNHESSSDGLDSSSIDSLEELIHEPDLASVPEEQCATISDSGTTSQNVLTSSTQQRHRPEDVVDHVREIEEHPLFSFNGRSSLEHMEEHIEEDLPVRYHITCETLGGGSSSKVDMSKAMNRRLLVGDEKIMALFYLSRASMKKLWNETKEEEGRFRYPVWVKSAVLTSIVMLFYACVKTIAFLVSLVDQYEEQRDRIEKHTEKLNDFLVGAGWQHGVNGISRTTIIRLFLILDKVIRSLKWSVFIGYPIGTLFGICSVITILVQYKRASLMVSTRMARLNSQSSEVEQGNRQSLALKKQYPAIKAYAFMAIVSSTAIVQAQIASFIICLALGLLSHCVELWFVLIYFGPFLLASLAILAFDFFSMKFLTHYFMHEDGREIKHPRGFDVFIMVSSTVHLLIGLLYALWRVVYLTMTTLFVLNRLDVSLFTSWKSLDNGHNAFMSMLTLNLVIQQDTDRFASRLRAEEEMLNQRDMSTRIH